MTRARSHARRVALAGRRLLRARVRGLVLCYHRVSEPSFDPWSLCVAPHNFRRHLEVLHRLGEPAPLADLLNGGHRGGRPRLAVTFDDGYADNLEHGLPLLERYGVPATIFLASGYVDAGRELWWDELERALFEPRRLPARLELVLGGHEKLTRVVAAGNTSERAQLYEDLYWLIRPLEPDARARITSELLSWAGLDSVPRPTHRVVSRAEVAGAARGGLVGFGAHTRRHPVLSLLDEQAQRAEIRDGKAEVEAMAGRSVGVFAYPHGRKSDYTATTVRIVRDAGFAQAFTTQPGTVRARSDPLELPRVSVGDSDTAGLRETLGGWLS